MGVPFIIGFIMGAAFVACGFVLMFTRKPKARTSSPRAKEYPELQKTVITQTSPNLVNKRRINIR